MFRALAIASATFEMFQGLTRSAPAPRDCAAPANYKNTKYQMSNPLAYHPSAIPYFMPLRA